MAKSEARKQKQLAKKKAKRSEKRTQLARLTTNNPTIQLASAEKWPVIEALVPENLWTTAQGIGQLAIARRAPDGRVACGIFLVDVYCLGVKNAFWRMGSMADFRSIVGKIEAHGDLLGVSPEYFAKLVLSAVDYAQSLGFHPHPDFRHTRLLLNGIDPSLCPDHFEFGKDGKPYYIRGPHETLEKARLIMDRVAAAGGHSLLLLSERMGGIPSLGEWSSDDLDDEDMLEDDSDDEEFDEEEFDE